MLNIPTDFIIERIKENTNLTEQQIKDKIKEKLDALSGLISEQGAAHIIANEMGVKLVDESSKLQIKNVLSGMRNIETVGRAVQIYEKRTFTTKAGKEGQVGNFLLGDETGRIRIVLWGDKADKLADIKENDIIKITGAYVKENPGFGGSGPRLEIHLGDNSKLEINPEGEDVKAVETGSASSAAQRKNISELKDQDDGIEVLGTVVQAFDTNFFEVCPECQKRTKPSPEGEYACVQHGKITPSFSYVTNAVVDDGTDNIRCVFFRNQTQHLFNKTDEEMQELRGKPFDEVKTELLGNIIKVVGRIVSNSMFNRLELVVRTVDAKPNPEEELKRLDSTDEKKEEKVVETPVVAEPVAQPATESVVEEKPAATEDVVKDEVVSEKVVEPVKETVSESTSSEPKVEEKPATESTSSEVEEEVVSLEDIESDSDSDDIYE